MPMSANLLATDETQQLQWVSVHQCKLAGSLYQRLLCIFYAGKVNSHSVSFLLNELII